MKTSEKIHNLIEKIETSNSFDDMKNNKQEIFKLIEEDPNLELLRKFLYWEHSLNHRIESTRNALDMRHNETPLHSIVEIVQEFES